MLSPIEDGRRLAVFLQCHNISIFWGQSQVLFAGGGFILKKQGGHGRKKGISFL
jgi:hypothetical protein